MHGVSRLAIMAIALNTATISTTMAQRNLDDIEVAYTDLGAGLYMLTGAGGNIGLSLGSDGVFLIDDQFSPLSEKILSAIEELGGGKPNYIINTHWHGDHTGGNEKFSALGALLVAHNNVRIRLSTPQHIKAIDARVDPRPTEALPVITYNDELKFHINNKTAHAVHVPRAHTDGDTMIVFDAEKVVHMGDLFFNGNFPFIDTSSGGSIDGLIAATEIVLSFTDADWKIVPGHGPLANKADLEFYHLMLTKVRDRVRAKIDEGKTLEQIIADDPLADLNDKWGQGFITTERIITPVYETMTQ